MWGALLGRWSWFVDEGVVDKCDSDCLASRMEVHIEVGRAIIQDGHVTILI